MNNNFKIFILVILLLLTITEYVEHKLIIQKLDGLQDDIDDILQNLEDFLEDEEDEENWK